MINDNTLIKISIILGIIAIFELCIFIFIIIPEIPPIDPHAIEYLRNCTDCVVY